MKAVVAQRGSREHYAIARALHSRGLLSALVTDWYAPSDSLTRFGLSCLGSTGQRMLAAEAAIPRSLVRHTRLRSLLERAFDWSAADPYEKFRKAGSQFALQSARILSQEVEQFSVVFAYSYAALELLEFARRERKQSILLQIDPGPKEFLLVDEEACRWPSFVKKRPVYPSAYYERLHDEWRLADRILVNSEWSARSIIEHGADPKKIRIVPLCYDEPESLPSRGKREATLKVLFLGQVNIRKGIQYLIEAASNLQQLPIEFVIAGPVQIPKEAVAGAPSNMKWLGPVPRSEVGSLYAAADVFILPTVSDGFAITQIEAMSYGLPSIVTPNCADVVIAGETGFVIPVRSSEAIISTLSSIYANRSQLSLMSKACLKRAKNFSLCELADQLEGIVRELQS